MTKPRYSINPLAAAAENGDLETVKRLIAEGADVNARDSVGRNAIFSAITSSSNTLLNLLIDKGSKLNYCDQWGQTVLDLALQKKQHNRCIPAIRGRSTTFLRSSSNQTFC